MPQLKLLLISALLPFLPTFAGLRAQSVGPAKVGDVVADFAFPDPVGHEGLDRLSDLRGHPVLVVGWRTHLADGMHAGRFAFQLEEEYGDDGLVVVYTDRNRWLANSGISSAGFWLETGGRIPFLTSSPTTQPETDLPIEWTCPRDDRSMALIGVDGVLLLVDSADDIGAKGQQANERVRDLVEGELRKRRLGWGADKGAERIRSLTFGSGRLAKAMALLETEATGDRAQLAAEIAGRFRAETKRIWYLIEQGRMGDAETRSRQLRKMVDGHTPWEQDLDELAVAFDSAEGRLDAKLDKELTKLLRPILGVPRKGRASVEILAELRLFARDHEGSRVAARAARLDHLVQSSLCSQLGMRWQEIETRANKLISKHR